MRAWALRDSATGLYLPWGEHNRNNSRQVFDSKDRPRIFNSKRAAVNTRTAWKFGVWKVQSVMHSYFGVDEGDYSLEPIAADGRQDVKIEIVEFDLVEVGH